MINFAEELEKQRKADQNLGAAPTVKEYKLAEGIYFSEFRSQKKDSTQQYGFEIQENQKQNYVPPRNPVILEADFKEFQKRIDKMKESIDEFLQMQFILKIEIVSIDQWKDDKEFIDAIEENYEAINNILQVFQEIDPCCDLIKKDTKEQIEQSIKANKIKQTVFLKEIYGLKGKDEQGETNLQDEKLKKDENNQNEQKQEDDNELEDDDIQSIQDQLDKQKLNNRNYKNDSNNDNDDGVYL